MKSFTDMSSQIIAAASERTIVYVDGFNLYFGLRAANLDRYRWLNIHALASKVVQTRQLLLTKYFTARISGPDHEKQRRQSTYLDALGTRLHLEIVYGHYLSNPKSCRNCGRVISSYSEKMTDVNIAVAVLTDMFADRIDTAIVVSGDSDLTPVFQASRALFPRKRILAGFPPKRVSSALKQVATSHFMIAETDIRNSQLPKEVVKSDGTRLVRPVSWG